jgi:hypothetical protein
LRVRAKAPAAAPPPLGRAGRRTPIGTAQSHSLTPPSSGNLSVSRPASHLRFPPSPAPLANPPTRERAAREANPKRPPHPVFRSPIISNVNQFPVAKHINSVKFQFLRPCPMRESVVGCARNQPRLESLSE